MEVIIVGLITGILQMVPSLVEAIKSSTVLDDKVKKKLLDDLDLRLLEAKNKVQAVRFKDIK